MDVRSPEPVVERVIETLYDTGVAGEKGIKFLVIRSAHDRGGQGFRHRVTRQERGRRVISEVIRLRELQPVPSGYTPIGRYSEKALIAAHAAYISANNLDSPESLRRLVGWASE